MANRHGFTLIELLLYIGISAIVLLALSAFFLMVLGARTRNETVSEVDDQGTAAMMVITQAIRNADEVISPLASITADSLSLTVEDVLKSPETFSVSGNSIIVTEGLNDPILLTNSRVRVSGFEITNLSKPGTPGNTRVIFTLTRVNTSPRREYDYSRTFEGSATLRQP